MILSKQKKIWIALACTFLLMVKIGVAHIEKRRFLDRSDTIYLKLRSRAQHASMADAVWESYDRMPYTINEDVEKLALEHGLRRGYVVIGTDGENVAWVKRLDDGGALGDHEYLLKWRYERPKKGIRLGEAWFLPRSNPSVSLRPPVYAEVKIGQKGHMMFVQVVDSDFRRHGSFWEKVSDPVIESLNFND